MFIALSFVQISFCVETIPLGPVFKNEKFNSLTPALQAYILRAIYLLAQARKLDPLPEHLRMYFYCCNAHFHRNKAVFRDILEEIVPKICKIKRLKKKQVANGHIAQSKKAVESRVKYQNQLLVDDIPENPVPILPQFSALSETLRRERVFNEAAFKAPLPTKKPPVKPPSLSEKPVNQ